MDPNTIKQQKPWTHHLVRDPTVRRLVLVVQHTEPHLIGGQGFQERRNGVAPLALGLDHKLVAGGVDLKDDKGRLPRSEFGNGDVHVGAQRNAALGGHFDKKISRAACFECNFQGNLIILPFLPV